MGTEFILLGLALLLSSWLVWVGVRLLQKAGRTSELCTLTPREARRLAFLNMAGALAVPICVVVYVAGGHVGWAVAGPPAVLLFLAAAVKLAQRQSHAPVSTETELS